MLGLLSKRLHHCRLLHRRFLLLALLIWYILNRTAFGRHIYATGDDPDSAGQRAQPLRDGAGIAALPAKR